MIQDRQLNESVLQKTAEDTVILQKARRVLLRFGYYRNYDEADKMAELSGEADKNPPCLETEIALIAQILRRVEAKDGKLLLGIKKTA